MYCITSYSCSKSLRIHPPLLVMGLVNDGRLCDVLIDLLMDSCDLHKQPPVTLLMHFLTSSYVAFTIVHTRFVKTSYRKFPRLAW